MKIVIMENMNCAIVFHVFIYKTKYPMHIVIYVTILRGDNSGMTHPQAFWKIQMRVRKWKQQKKKQLGNVP
jgi:hypothetical protein